MCSQLLQILYSSIATNPLGHRTDLEIFETSMRNNKRLEVTGFLARSEQQFFQYIEGPGDAVDAIFEAIQSDPRNRECQLKFRNSAPSRRFSQWQMGYFTSTAKLHGQHERIWFRRATELPEGAAFLKLLASTAQENSMNAYREMTQFMKKKAASGNT